MSDANVLKAIECVLNVYRKKDLTGTTLRTKMTRAANEFEKTGKEPKLLVTFDDPRLHSDINNCHLYHIDGVTFFRTVKDAKKSPLYMAAEELGKKSPSPAFVESRRHKGQSTEEWKTRIASNRLERSPEHQTKERASLTEKQNIERMDLERRFAKLKQQTEAKLRQTSGKTSQPSNDSEVDY